MKLALIADVYPPMRSSGAVLIHDLAQAMVEHGHDVTVLVPAPGISRSVEVERTGKLTVVRIKTLDTRDKPYAWRMMAEAAMPLIMRRRLKKAKFDLASFDGLAWYSPSIFFGPLVAAIKRESGCPGYLILRDIFPEWAADLGLIGRGVPFRALQAVARYQYRQADIIGVQTPGNLAFFEEVSGVSARIEVLQNWMAPAKSGPCSIDLSSGPLKGRTIFAYTGNMGVAQDMDKIMRLAAALKDDSRVGFVFVGRGSEAERLRGEVAQRSLDNVLMFDEIGTDEMGGLYDQVDYGLVSLSHKHKWHNIPGKFIGYMHAGLPVLASVNPGNDMITLIDDEQVGKASTDPNGEDLVPLALQLVDAKAGQGAMAARCRDLAQRLFSADTCATQIEDALAAGGQKENPGA